MEIVDDGKEVCWRVCGEVGEEAGREERVVLVLLEMRKARGQNGGVAVGVGCVVGVEFVFFGDGAGGVVVVASMASSVRACARRACGG